MAIEKKWARIAPVPFTTDGGEDGKFTVSNVVCFKVKQKVKLSAAGEPDVVVEIKRIPSITTIIVGSVKIKKQSGIAGRGNLSDRADISAYTVAKGATISAEEQDRGKAQNIAWEDIRRVVYEEEPTVAIRTILVDKIGNPYTDNNKFPVSGTFSADIDHPNREGLSVKNIPTKNTEVSFTFPDKLAFYQIRVRDHADVIKVGLSAGNIASGTYWTIDFGNIYSPEVHNDFQNGYTLYFESKHKNNVDLEIRYWYFA